MIGGLGGRLGSAGLMAGVVAAMMAGSSGVAAAKEDVGGCIYYAPGEAGGPTTCPGWIADSKDLSGRDFTGADLTDASFHEANLGGTNFTNANLSGVDAQSPNMNAQTQLRGAIVDHATYLQGLVKYQEVTVNLGTGAKRYFIVGGVNPGFPARFRPPAVPGGVFIDECKSINATTVRASVNGQDVDVKVLRPGQYRLRCTFFTAGRQDGTGITSFSVQVNDNLSAGPADS